MGKDTSAKPKASPARVKEVAPPINKDREQLFNSYSFIGQALRELTQDEIEMIIQVEETKRINDNHKFIKTYNEIYGTHIVACNCGGLYNDLLTKLSIQKQYQLLK